MRHISQGGVFLKFFAKGQRYPGFSLRYLVVGKD